MSSGRRCFLLFQLECAIPAVFCPEKSKGRKKTSSTIFPFAVFTAALCSDWSVFVNTPWKAKKCWHRVASIIIRCDTWCLIPDIRSLHPTSDTDSVAVDWGFSVDMMTPLQHWMDEFYKHTFTYKLYFNLTYSSVIYLLLNLIYFFSSVTLYLLYDVMEDSYSVVLLLVLRGVRVRFVSCLNWRSLLCSQFQTFSHWPS